MEYNLVYPNINFIHKMNCNSDFFDNSERYHIIYEMFFWVEGDAELIAENKKYHMSGGDLAFIQPGQHYRFIPRSNSRYNLYIIKFTEQEIPKDLLPFLKEKNTYTSVIQTVIPQLFERMDWHYQYYKGNSLEHLAKSVLTEIIAYFCNRENADCNTALYNKKMAEVVDYINQNVALPLKISDICEHFHYSKSYICKEFLRCMDVPIIQYVRTKKVLLADSIIKRGVKPTAAYKQCGFSDYSTFFRAYRKIIGVPPSSY